MKKIFFLITGLMSLIGALVIIWIYNQKHDKNENEKCILQLPDKANISIDIEKNDNSLIVYISNYSGEEVLCGYDYTIEKKERDGWREDKNGKAYYAIEYIVENGEKKKINEIDVNLMKGDYKLSKVVEYNDEQYLIECEFMI